MYSTHDIRQALKKGGINGYELFLESNNKGILEKIKKHAPINNMAEELKSYADMCFKESSPAITFEMFMEYEVSGNRTNYQSAYFTRRKQLFSLVCAFIIYNDHKYIPIIEEKLWEWCELYTWELPAHVPMTVHAIEELGITPDCHIGLFSAETAFFLAEILYIIEKDINSLITYRVRQEIFRRVLNPYKEGNFLW